MTIEKEIENTVSIKTENIMRELNKIIPSIKQIGDKIKEVFKNISFTDMIKKLQTATQSVKNKLKEINQNNELKLTINNKEIDNQIGQIEKQIKSLQDKTSAEIISFMFNYNGNGEVMIKNISIALDNLLIAMDNVMKSEGFQNWLKNCSDKFREITEKIASIDWQPLVNALSTVGTTIGSAAIEILNGVVDVFKWIVENQMVSEILLAIAAAISIVSTAMGIWNAIQWILNSALLTCPLTWIILAIIALIAIIILCVSHWEEIKNAVINTWQTIVDTISTALEPIKEYLTNLWDNISFIFEAIWNVISTVLGFIWNMFSTAFTAIWDIVSPIINAIWNIISTIFQAVWTIISSILGSIWNIFSQIFNWIWQLVSKVFQGIWDVISPIINKVWETIKTILGKIQTVWSNIWNTIKTTVTNIWNGIWSVIKKVINSILGGIESFVNGVIKGINFVLKGISQVANAIGSLIGLDPINLQISMISLPRLAKGNVAYSPMIAQFGEYVGASTNPEITAPQSILRETFDEVLSNHEIGNRQSGVPVQLAVYVGNKKLGDILLDDLREKRRSTGKGLEVLVGN